VELGLQKVLTRAEYVKMNLAVLNLVFITKEIIASTTLQSQRQNSPRNCLSFKLPLNEISPKRFLISPS
jgi:hypothetical protein